MISVVIPCYNASKFVETAINSIFEQTTKLDFEIIIVDDGSSDNLIEVVSKYDNLKYIKQKNGGVSKARNTGILNSFFEYVIFLDADDRFNKNLFCELKKRIEDGYDLISWGYLVEKNGSVSDYTNYRIENSEFVGDEFIKLFLSKTVYQCICSFCVKKSVLIQNNITFDVGYKYSEDINFQIEVMSNSHKIKYINKPMFVYTITGTSATSIVSSERIRSISLFDKTREKISENLHDSFDQYVGMNYLYRIGLVIKCENKSCELFESLISTSHVLKRPRLSLSNKRKFVMTVAKTSLPIIKFWFKISKLKYRNRS
ncbi:hypothetical protein GCM10007906_30630 [Vibrio hyugaensis]|uniref:Glycosyltransferase 2-like domain-containing protein n=1 Tax=Vibrio hyugaensis TaxID=1534743 RepID=A0ABQ5Y8Q9_9VIBR|nr:glycosyltransferase family 2 protein [Vibrio hyugaensis]GLR05475.1 hypothetical protein GCM10007906_30630 [Vibrio hyugaensis]